jgi:hypothetical protein
VDPVLTTPTTTRRPLGVCLVPGDGASFLVVTPVDLLATAATRGLMAAGVAAPAAAHVKQRWVYARVLGPSPWKPPV